MLEWFNQLHVGWRILLWIGIVLVIAFLSWGALKLNRRVFRKLQEKHRGIHLAFFERINSALIVVFLIIFAVSLFSGTRTVWQTIFGGTAIVSAVLAFAAQDVIKDILAGLMLSIYKPFEIGDRIILEDGTEGIVKSISLRHVVIVEIDSHHIIIPNSKLNAMQLSNFSYESELLSIQFRFSVSYDSDMAEVKRVIASATAESPYSVPGKRDENGNPCYGPVYFIAFADSALIMAVTVYYEKAHDPEVVISDVNTRVREALIANNIEIPYNYINVINATK